MNKPLFALIDCNNFFVSCERLFRPDLNKMPVVVLSSNDGCVISRSNEAKALGIPMAAPAFKYKQIFKEKSVVQFSANFDLYGDLSKRISDLLATITPRIEIYSVDEAFLDLSTLTLPDLKQWGIEVKNSLQRLVGIPVSIGIAPTKTLAKLANQQAKKQTTLKGVRLLEPSNLTESLKSTPLDEVWGIGRRLAPVLKASGLGTADELARLPRALARQLVGGVRGEQLVRELNGQSCLPLTTLGQAAKSISRSRTFGEDTCQFYDLEAAIASFTAQAAYRLRRSGQLATRASLFLATNRHKPGYQHFWQEVRLNVPSADTGWLMSRLVAALKVIYNPALEYHQAGITLYDFVPTNSLQIDLVGNLDVHKFDRSTARLAAVDKLNARFGKKRVHYAAEDLGASWQPKRNVRSPRYTSQWEELPTVRIAAGAKP